MFFQTGCFKYATEVIMKVIRSCNGSKRRYEMKNITLCLVMDKF